MNKGVGRGVKALGKAIVFLTLFVLIAVGFGVARQVVESSDSDDLVYNNLEYTIAPLENGDVKIKEVVTVSMDDRDRPWKQLFQNYTLSTENLTAISGISVRNLTTGQEYKRAPFANVDTEEVSVSDWDEKAANTWYLRAADSSTDITEGERIGLSQSGQNAYTRAVELGWNIPVTESGVQTFEITMTWHDVSESLADAMYTKIEPISANNTVPIKHLKGTITYPSSTQKSWTWMHYAGNGTVKKISDTTYEFSADNVLTNTHVDLVMLADMPQVDLTKLLHHNMDTRSDDIVSNEQDRYKTWLAQQQRDAYLRLVLLGAVIVVALIVIVWLIAGARSSYKKSQYTGGIEYFREPVPVSPAAAAKIYAVVEGRHVNKKTIENRALSATLLSLLSKKALYILPGDAQNYEQIPLNYNSNTELNEQIASATRARAQGATAAAQLQSAISQAEGNKKHMTYIVSREAFGSAFARDHHLSDSESRLLNVLLDVAAERDSFVFSDRDIKAVSNNYDTHRASHIRSMVASFDQEYLVLNISRGSWAQTNLPQLLALVLCGAAAWLSAYNSYFAAYMIIGAIVAFVYGWANSYGSQKILNDTHSQLVGQVQGLARYLNDFSDFSDRGVEEMKLWDRYIVYAAAFGMSEKVARTMYQTAMNMARTNPEVLDDVAFASTQWLWMPRYRVTGMMDSGIDSSTYADMNSPWAGGGPDFSSVGNFMDSFNNSLDSIQSDFVTATIDPSSSHSSSGGFGGSGGSFGGVGGGAGGGSFGGR